LKDLYAILGLAPDCEPEEIKAAYRALVLLHHPDQNPDRPDAHERFLEIKDAYELLSDPELREDYDLAFVETFPGYAIEGEEEEEEEEEYWEENPPARMPITHGDATNGMLRMLMVLILPIICAALTWIISESVAMTLAFLAGGFGLALWLGSLLGDDS
jgi:curved DNA-binding protein CbpA